MRVVDFQHHFVPRELAERRGGASGKRHDVTEGGMKKVTLHEKLYDPEEQLRDMDEAGLDIAVLSCIVGWDAPLEDCRLINDTYAALQQQYPDRFAGLAHLPLMIDTPAAVSKELERAVRDLGLRGVTITSQVNGLPLDSPQLWEFYARTVELRVPIFVHPSMPPRGYEWIKEFDLSRIVGRELDLTLAATRLIAAGVLDRFPDLKMIIAHFGGGIAAIKERISAKAYRFGTPLKRSFDDYFDLLYFDMSGFEGGPNALRCALTGIKPERMVFATDYPQDFTGATTGTGKGPKDIRKYIEEIRGLPLPEKTKAAMLGETAAELLGLSR
jgi:predicted TIM-barrel fold metal-dependent hydrolase